MNDTQGPIPNNVGLAGDPKLQRALLAWQPRFLDWWRDAGPEDLDHDWIYLRTAVSVEAGGWANFDYVRLPEYRWGIFLAPTERTTIGFGDCAAAPVWNEVPGEVRTKLKAKFPQIFSK